MSSTTPQAFSLRRFEPADAPQVARLFYDTVHTINARDYDPTQLEAWAPTAAGSGPTDVVGTRWLDRFSRSIAYVACAGEAANPVSANPAGGGSWAGSATRPIIGFGDLTPAGVLDHLYVHKDYQGRGVGTLLADRLEAEARAAGLAEVVAEVSITAWPFFDRQGYELVRPQNKVHGGTVFLNYVMRKPLKS